MSAWDEFGSSIIEFFNDDPLTVTYIQQSEGSYNPSTSEYESTLVETECKAIILDLTRNLSGLSSKYGGLIMEGDKELWVLPPNIENSSASELVINTTSDKVLVGNILYSVVNMKEINPGNKTLVYNLMIRR